MNHRLLFDFDNEDEIDEAIIVMQRRPRIFYKRVNYLEFYDDKDFVNRFHISKETFLTLLTCKLYMMLRYLATGSFLLSVADFTGVSESSASRYIHEVCRAVAKHKSTLFIFLKMLLIRGK